jgi:hypothetical protein
MVGIATKIAVIAGPVILALMGVAVSVWPPKKKIIHWTWGIAFAAVGIITIAGSVKQQQDSDNALAEQTKAFQGLERAIKDLTKPLRNDSTQRDPDTIYQNGVGVGHVISPRITPNESKIYFEEIQNAGNLDRSKSFEYRDFVLKMISADSYIGMLVTPSGVATSVYRHAVCEIVGRATK